MKQASTSRAIWLWTNALAEQGIHQSSNLNSQSYHIIDWILWTNKLKNKNVFNTFFWLCHVADPCWDCWGQCLEWSLGNSTPSKGFLRGHDPHLHVKLLVSNRLSLHGFLVDRMAGVYIFKPTPEVRKHSLPLCLVIVEVKPTQEKFWV